MLSASDSVVVCFLRRTSIRRFLLVFDLTLTNGEGSVLTLTKGAVYV
jgi:hypothetical protein